MFEGEKTYLSPLGHDVGPGNIKILAAKEMVDRKILQDKGSNQLKLYLHKFVSPDASVNEKWDAFRLHVLLKSAGAARFAAEYMLEDEKGLRLI